MEHIARKVGKDPVEIRIKNLLAGSEMTKLLPEFVKSVGEFWGCNDYDNRIKASGKLKLLGKFQQIINSLLQKSIKTELNFPENLFTFNYAFYFLLDYHIRKKEIDKFNAQNRWIKRGISIIPMKYHLGYFGTSHALVSIYHGDGSVAITVGSVEMGQGLNTKVAQTAAFVLGVAMDKISIKPTNTLSTPNAIVTGASIGSEISCFVSFL